jgi:hypothetical protein
MKTGKAKSFLSLKHPSSVRPWVYIKHF